MRSLDAGQRASPEVEHRPRRSRGMVLAYRSPLSDATPPDDSIELAGGIMSLRKQGSAGMASDARGGRVAGAWRGDPGSPGPQALLGSPQVEAHACPGAYANTGPSVPTIVRCHTARLAYRLDDEHGHVIAPGSLASSSQGAHRCHERPQWPEVA